MTPAPKAIIVGASSGIGRALAVRLSQAGYRLGITARRTELLQELRSELPGETIARHMDLHDIDASVYELKDLISHMGGVDLIILNAGINRGNEALDFKPENETLIVNAQAFMALACAAIESFKLEGRGHLVGISSIAGLRGSPKCPAYSATKAFVSNYLEALRYNLAGTPIAVTDIRPGFVETAMISRKESFWVASCELAAEQIYTAIQKRKKVAYITRKWFFVALLYKLIPGFVLQFLHRQFGSKEKI